MTRIATLSLALLAACATTEDVAQLERLDVSLPDGARTAAGEAAVTGADRDWTLALVQGSDTVEIGVHSPTGADLTRLDGEQVELERTGDSDRSILVTDSDGLHYAAVVEEDGNALADHFGSPPVDFGPVVAEWKRGREEWTAYSAVVHTDDGALEMLAGEVRTVTLDGADWRIGIVAAYSASEAPRGGAKCGGTWERELSYELLRVDTPEPEAFIDPTAARELRGFGSCG